MNYLEKSHSEKCIVLHIYLYYASITIFDVKERNFKLFHFHPILMQFFCQNIIFKKKGTQISKFHIFGNLQKTKTDIKWWKYLPIPFGSRELKTVNTLYDTIGPFVYNKLSYRTNIYSKMQLFQLKKYITRLSTNYIMHL